MKVSLKVGCLPYAVGKQPLILVNNLVKKMNVKMIMMMIACVQFIVLLGVDNESRSSF